MAKPGRARRGSWRLTRDELCALAVVIPLAALAGYTAAHKAAPPSGARSSGDLFLEGTVPHIRDGDTIEVRGVPVRIANLDCAERGTTQGDRATALMRQLATQASATCNLEGRRSYDREVGVCSIAGVGDVGEAMIRARACERW